MKSRPDSSWPNSVTQGAVSPMTHDSEASSSNRITSARASPTTRARACCPAGSLPDRIDRNTTLSMPSTISSSSNVTKASHSSGLVIHPTGSLPGYSGISPSTVPGNRGNCSTKQLLMA